MNTGGLFTPEDDGLSRDTMVRGALAAIDGFTDSFNRHDLAGMDRRLHFPHVILSAEKLVLWDRPGQMPPGFFADLAETGWRRTEYLDRRPVLVSPRKVHLVVDYTRDRADGTVISRHENLWIVTLENGRWGIKQRSY